MHRTSTRSPPFLKEDESICRILSNYVDKKRIMMKYKKLWKTMIHSLKDKCFKMHFRKIQELKKRQMTSPRDIPPQKIKQSYTHKPPTFTQTKIFREFFGKVFENVRNRSFFGIVFDTIKNDRKKHPYKPRKALVLIVYTF